MDQVHSKVVVEMENTSEKWIKKWKELPSVLRLRLDSDKNNLNYHRLIIR